MATEGENGIKESSVGSRQNGTVAILALAEGSKVDVPAGLVKRHEERMAKLAKEQELRESGLVKEESVEYFTKTFNRERVNIEDRLLTASKIQKSELIGYFDGVTESAHKLEKYVADMATFLPRYDKRCAQERLGKLFEKVNESRDKYLPKKKFQFKERKRGDVQNKPQDNIGHDTTDAPLVTAPVETCGFSNRISELLTLGSNEVHLKDVSLSNLTRCTVKLFGSPSAMHISNLSECKIFCGPIPGSVFAHKCEDSTLVLACQQLRVHNTTDSNFYIHVTSRAIIEDTTRVHYAPYNWSYEGLEEDYKQSGLDRSRNAWNDIDDFNWLAHDEHSPNWDLIPEEERVTKWD